MQENPFARRHIGPREEDVTEMLKTIGTSSIEELIDETLPASIRLNEPPNIGKALSEPEYLQKMRELAKENTLHKTYIGLGYYDCHTPSVILRNVFENPGWYTAYTPYQAEIAQGRLEALLNFQTVVMDLTAMEIANASLLDEGTAAAEAMIMFYNTRSREAAKNGVNKFFASATCFPQTIAVLKTRAKFLEIELVLGDHRSVTIDSTFFGALVQYPDAEGNVHDYTAFCTAAKAAGAHVAVAADLLSLALLTPPGEWGADCVLGNTQRFGVPLGYGGPHAAYFATRENFKRHIPGRIIGVSTDSEGRNAYRMALQTREQHIRRDKATSNICTAQALLAVMAGMYAVYHGPQGIRAIAEHCHKTASAVAAAAKSIGFTCTNNQFFDTVTLKLPTGTSAQALEKLALEHGINFYYPTENTVSIAVNETTTADDVNNIVTVLEKAGGQTASTTSQDIIAESALTLESNMLRTSSYLQHPVFNIHHSETSMMRYLKALENRDVSLTHSMIPLGSCTMKLNAASELIPLSWPEFAGLHPFVPKDQATGYQKMIAELEGDLAAITGFAGVSLQPNSGAQGEYAGLVVIKAYHESRGDHHRDIVLIPSSAHGTNPASAVMAGMKVKVVKCDEMGNIDVSDLRAKAEEHAANLAALMVTYPSTHGVFEEAIIEINEVMHQHGGQVYMDGANMNAQVGLTSPGTIGADVCHLNLHKTFAIPHGGGGPGMGPIGVAAHLVPFLPTHPVVATGGDQGIDAVSAAPYGSSLILLISYGYIKMLGTDGLLNSTRFAILNANYIKSKLEGNYNVLYQGKKGRVAHEMILDCRGFKKSGGIEVEDIAKRLMDFGFHAPTVSFPVPGTVMIEPTESEPKEELDRFCDAMLCIKREIEEVASGQAHATDNVLKNAPHTVTTVVSDSWNKEYSREKAAFPLPFVRTAKFWPAVGRIDNAFGDRNLVCSCPSMESYEEELV